jgi:hypothetical protein
MSSVASNSATIIRERIVSFSRQQDGICCVLADQRKVFLPRLLASHIAIGDEITFPCMAQIPEIGSENKAAFRRID